MSGKTPTPRPGAPVEASSRPPADRLALAAMIVGVAAFLGGWLPVLGLILGAIGVILALVARRRSNRPGLAKTALVLSSLAVVTNIIVDVLVVVSIVTQYNNLPA